MSDSRELLICSAAERAGLPSQFAQSVMSECPWLDGTSTVSEDLAPELFAEPAAPLALGSAELQQFCSHYNSLVEAVLDPHRSERSQAYVALANALSPFGREGTGEGCAFWLVDDSFSTPTPSLVLINGHRLSPQAIAAVQAELSRFPAVLSELRVTNEEGDELFTVKPQ